MTNMPNFLIVGAHKAGTTSLYQYLKQHPQIFMGPVKEPHFFSFTGHPLNFNDPGFEPEKSRSFSAINNCRSLFKNTGDAVAIGEASTSYLYVTQTPLKIHAYIPKVKIIAILRNPIERAYSNFLHCRARKNNEPIEDFSEALKAKSMRIQSNWSPLWHYQRMGFYYEQLQHYYKQFPEEQILVYLFDDLISKAGELFQDMFAFLQVDTAFMPDLSKQDNVSGIPKNEVWRFIFQLSQRLNLYLPKKLKCRLKNPFL